MLGRIRMSNKTVELKKINKLKSNFSTVRNFAQITQKLARK